MQRLTHFFFCAAIFSLCLNSRADQLEDAKTLKDEALKILKDNAEKEASPEEYASCIFKLERAQALIEASGNNDTPLAQEVSSSLFWARRFSNLKVMSALDVLKGKQPVAAAAPPKKVPPKVVTPPAAKADPNDTPELVRNRLADSAYLDAQKFVGSHAGDDYAIALAWFQMAGQHPGTDASLIALDLAREAQMRFSGKKSAVVEEELPDTPENTLLKSADALAKSKQYEAAFPIYEQSVKLKETAVARRHKAIAHYQRAQQVREELKPKFAANATAYGAAYQNSWVTTRLGKVYNPDSAAMAGWKRERAALQKQADAANKNFETAEHDFAKVLKLSPEEKDFDAAGYMGLCIGVRPFFRSKGVSTLEAFIKDYTPTNDVQRSLYEFCKTEIARLKKGD